MGGMTVHSICVSISAVDVAVAADSVDSVDFIHSVDTIGVVRTSWSHCSTGDGEDWQCQRVGDGLVEDILEEG